MFSYEVLQSFNNLEMLVYNYVMEHRHEVQYMTIRELAEAVHVSTSTVVRFMIIPLIPAPSPVRNIVPKLPGS